MNIRDFEAPEFTSEWLKDIFEKQTALIDKYAEIEGMPEYPMNINTREGQKWIKDFLWRTTEEMAESYEAYCMEQNEEHTIEELIDGLHFFVELIIIAGKDWEWAREQLDTSHPVPLQRNGRPAAYWQTVYYLGLVGNTLKNKPWKQTEMMTDENKFYANLGMAFKSLFECLAKMGADEQVVYNYYTRKNQVNQFRQRSNY